MPARGCRQEVSADGASVPCSLSKGYLASSQRQRAMEGLQEWCSTRYWALNSLSADHTTVEGQAWYHIANVKSRILRGRVDL